MATRPTVSNLASTSRYTTLGLNDRLQTLVAAHDNVLGRDGKSGENNSMQGDIDMGGNKITNLGAPSVGTDAARYMDIALMASGGSIDVDLNLGGMLQVTDFGADGNGTTDDTVAIQAAVDAAIGNDAWLWWPSGTYNTTASISNLHTVTHLGPGIIKRGANLFTLSLISSDPPSDSTSDNDKDVAQTNCNKLYVMDESTGGYTGNDGLSSSEATTLPTIESILRNYGPILKGTWKVYILDTAADPNYSQVRLDSIESENYLYFIGANGTTTVGDYEEPLTVMSGASGPGTYCFYFRYNMKVKLMNIWFKDYLTGAGASPVNLEKGGELYSKNCWYTNNTYTGIYVRNNAYLYVDGGKFYDNANYHINLYSHVTGTIGYNGEAAANRPYFGALAGGGGGAGVHLQNQCNAHIDFCDFEDVNESGGAVQIVASSRAHLVSVVTDGCYYNVRCDNGSTYIDTDCTFGAAVSGVSIVAYGMSVPYDDNTFFAFNTTNKAFRIGPDSSLVPQATVHIIGDRVTSPSTISYNSNTLLALEASSTSPYVTFATADDGLAGLFFLEASSTATNETAFRYNFSNDSFEMVINQVGEYSFSPASMNPYEDNVNKCGTLTRRWSEVHGVALYFGTGDRTIQELAGSPEGSLAAPVGSLCSDVTNGKLYFKKTGSGNTGWGEVTVA